MSIQSLRCIPSTSYVSFIFYLLSVACRRRSVVCAGEHAGGRGRLRAAAARSALVRVAARYYALLVCLSSSIVVVVVVLTSSDFMMRAVLSSSCFLLTSLHCHCYLDLQRVPSVVSGFIDVNLTFKFCASFIISFTGRLCYRFRRLRRS